MNDNQSQLLNLKPGTPLLVDGMLALHIAYDTSMVYRWVDTSKVLSNRKYPPGDFARQSATSLGIKDVDESSYDDIYSASTIDVIGTPPPENAIKRGFNIGTKVNIVGCGNAVILGFSDITTSRVHVAYYNGIYTSVGCSPPPQNVVSEAVIRSLDFDPNNRCFDSIHIESQYIQLLEKNSVKSVESIPSSSGEKQEPVVVENQPEATPVVIKKTVTKDTPPGTKVVYKGREATVVIYYDPYIFFRFSKPYQDDLALDSSDAESSYTRAAEALGFSPKEHAYYFTHSDNLQLVDIPEQASKQMELLEESKAKSPKSIFPLFLGALAGSALMSWLKSDQAKARIEIDDEIPIEWVEFEEEEASI